MADQGAGCGGGAGGGAGGGWCIAFHIQARRSSVT